MGLGAELPIPLGEGALLGLGAPETAPVGLGALLAAPGTLPPGVLGLGAELVALPEGVVSMSATGCSPLAVRRVSRAAVNETISLRWVIISAHPAPRKAVRDALQCEADLAYAPRVRVEVREVWKRFDAILAVSGVSLTIEPGTLLGLIGPNGAGKTSLLKMIATLSKPDRGQVLIDGRDALLAVGPIRRRLGYMPAEFGRMPDMTVREYLSYFGAAAGVPRAERLRRVEEVLELVDLRERADTPVASGSTGIKQRVLIAKTLVHDPELLVLDEPAAGLDPRARVEVREILRELNRLGKSIVVSSHILADLEEICDQVAIIEHGRLSAHGTIGQLTEALRGKRPAGSRWELTVPPADVTRAFELLAALADLEGLTRAEGGLRFGSRAGHVNHALAALLAAEVPVLALSREGPRLEDVFMQRTEGTIL